MAILLAVEMEKVAHNRVANSIIYLLGITRCSTTSSESLCSLFSLSFDLMVGWFDMGCAYYCLIRPNLLCVSCP